MAIVYNQSAKNTRFLTYVTCEAPATKSDGRDSPDHLRRPVARQDFPERGSLIRRMRTPSQEESP